MVLVALIIQRKACEKNYRRRILTISEAKNN